MADNPTANPVRAIFGRESKLTEAWEWIQTWLAPWAPAVWTVLRGGSTHEVRRDIEQVLRKHLKIDVQFATPADAEYMIMLRDALARTNCPPDWETKCRETLSFFGGQGSGTGENAPLLPDELKDMVNSLAQLLEGIEEKDAETLVRQREVGRDLLWHIIMAGSNAERRAIMRAATLIKMDPSEYREDKGAARDEAMKAAEKFKQATEQWIKDYPVGGLVRLINSFDTAAGKANAALQQHRTKSAAQPQTKRRWFFKK